MKNIHFTCTAQNLFWGQEKKDFNAWLDEKYAEQASQTAQKLKEKIEKIMSNTKCDYFGIALTHAVESTPRYCYIKNTNLNGKPDETCDIEIDLIKCTYSEIEHL